MPSPVFAIFRTEIDRLRKKSIYLANTFLFDSKKKRYFNFIIKYLRLKRRRIQKDGSRVERYYGLRNSVSLLIAGGAVWIVLRFLDEKKNPEKYKRTEKI